jgi:hypothetical protein
VGRSVPAKTIVRAMGGGHGHGSADGHHGDDHHGDGHDDHHGPLMPPFARLAPPKDSVSIPFFNFIISRFLSCR